MSDSIETMVEYQRERLAALEKIAQEVPDARSSTLADGRPVIVGSITPDRLMLVQAEKETYIYAYRKYGDCAVFHPCAQSAALVLLDLERSNPHAYGVLIEAVNRGLGGL